ncbi:hypothetical protein BJ165DRAFT_1416792 [Panaeolus papilionaceus]|nr:hypothetical protein BJ165DRAFT_1416792 [Panaeolus papilionaceus]
MKDWTAPIYAFYHPIPVIGHENKRRYHEFQCYVKGCDKKIQRYLDTKDATSSGNMRKHAKKCWGDEAVNTAGAARNVKAAREVLLKTKRKDGSLAAAFLAQGDTLLTYSHCQHTSQQTRYVLMKTGRPEYQLPSPTTVSRDVQVVFANAKKRISSILKKYTGHLHFATDAWTSPNHRAFVAITVHFEHEGKPIVLLLDVIEVSESHTGEALADVFHVNPTCS